jgi:HD-GYP domain-containing protein (c-di-GMP phosphodiesterase class II)
MERLAASVLTPTSVPLSPDEMAREIERLRAQVRRLESELARARTGGAAAAAYDPGKALLGYVVDVLCTLLHPRRGSTIIADVAKSAVRREIIDAQSAVGALQLALERPSLLEAISGQATRLTTRYESVLWLNILPTTETGVILCLRRAANESFSPREQQMGEVLGPLLISALQSGHRLFDLAEDAEALHTLGDLLSARMRAGTGRLAAMEYDAERLAKILGCNALESKSVRMATILHDIGTVDLPEEVLINEGMLSANEVAQMRQHTIFGMEIVRQIVGMERALDLILYHHERWDGAGYPVGLSGEEIPIGAQIVAVIDALHAMISPRPYRNTLPRTEAIAELRRCAGSQFDPYVVEAYAEVLEKNS